MTNEEFDNVYDKMSGSYGMLDSIMGELVNYENGMTGDDLKLLLDSLSELGKNMLFCQKEFVYSYAEKKEKDYLMSNLDNKIDSLDFGKSIAR